MKNKTLNVLDLAWKIFKQDNSITNFGYALKLAWRIVKVSTVKKVNNTLEYILNKSLRKIDLAVEVIERVGRKVIIKDDSYNFNLINYELKFQVI